ncbi:hypothetical protein HY948_04535 [Candidatus Gottesmanbacteria bacterium]|nr:hypothetical protein [Candidatus Gottesmanbacteria bacterium]
MKRILFALAALSLAVGTSFATTRAAWTDTVTVTSNEVQTGTADLRVATDGTSTAASGNWDTASQTSVFSVTGLVPGDTPKELYSFSLYNNSTNPIAFSLAGQITTSTITPDSGVDKTKLLLQVYNYDTPAEVSAWKTLEEWEAGTVSLGSNLSNATVKRYGIKAQLDIDALDEWQTQVVDFTLTVTGTQI